MPRTPKEVPDAELAVLQILWRDGEATMRALADELYPGGGSSEAATVQKLCERLANKGFVVADKQHRPFRFRARVGRDELIGRQLATLAEKLCGGSFAPLVSHLMEGGKLTAAERRALRERMEKAPKERKGRK
jgi:predicted transcriptional regulator